MSKKKNTKPNSVWQDIDYNTVPKNTMVLVKNSSGTYFNIYWGYFEDNPNKDEQVKVIFRSSLSFGDANAYYQWCYLPE